VTVGAGYFGGVRWSVAFVFCLTVVITGCGASSASTPLPAQLATPPRPVALERGAAPVFAPDGRLLVSDPRGSASCLVSEVRDDGHRVPVRRLAGCNEAAVLSPDASAVAVVGSDDGPYRLAVRRMSDGRRRFETPVSASSLEELRVHWSPDGRFLLTEFGGRTDTTVFNARTGRRIRRIDGIVDYLGRSPFSPDGRRVVIADQRGNVLISVATGRRTRVPVTERLLRPVFSPDGRAIAGIDSGKVVWVDLTSGGTHSVVLDEAADVAWSPDMRQLAVYRSTDNGDACAVSVIDVATGTTTDIAHFGFIQCLERADLAWSPDETKLAFLVLPP
jgi:Tol biopolymer transport system component